MHPTAELFTEKAWGAVVAAQQLAQQRRQQQMESEHLLAALLAQQGLASRVLEKAGVDVGNLNQRVESFIAKRHAQCCIRALWFCLIAGADCCS